MNYFFAFTKNSAEITSDLFYNPYWSDCFGAC
jgi:hypothetical protein